MNVTVREQIVIRATAEEVWDYTQDWQRRPEWDRSVVHAEVLEQSPRVVRMRGVGIVAVVRYKLEEKPHRTSLALTDVKSSIITGGGGSWEYVPGEQGTTFLQTNTLTLKDGLLIRALAPLLRWMFRMSTRRALAKAKAIIEHGRVGSPETNGAIR